MQICFLHSHSNTIKHYKGWYRCDNIQNDIINAIQKNYNIKWCDDTPISKAMYISLCDGIVISNYNQLKNYNTFEKQNNNYPSYCNYVCEIDYNSIVLFDNTTEKRIYDNDLTYKYSGCYVATKEEMVKALHITNICNYKNKHTYLCVNVPTNKPNISMKIVMTVHKIKPFTL